MRHVQVRRVAHASPEYLGSRLPSALQQKWARHADQQYHNVRKIYLHLAEKCLWWRQQIRHSTNKKKRRHAKKCFLRYYPTMMAMTQIGMDDHLPFGIPQKLDHFFYRLNTQKKQLLR